MNSVSAVIAAFALAVPLTHAAAPPGAPAGHEAPPGPADGPASLQRQEPDPFRQFADSYRPEVQNQVHIEQRVIIRIAPGRPKGRDDLFAHAPRSDAPAGYKEKKLHGCIAIEDIAGAEPVEDRLLLFMRDHSVLSAALERACDADDFYLGFYVERNADGMLCSKRDKLQARTGATCQVTQLNRLVAVKD